MSWRISACALAAVLACALGAGPACAAPALPGDANLDGRVDKLDAAILAAHWFKPSVPGTNGDFNGDGMVDDLDLGILAANWSLDPPPEEPGMDNPEPASLAVWAFLGLCAAGVAWRRRRKRSG
ncbi:MAG: PEP-CTERM sorting domain-containing protein [Pirellulales bacterium]|nr:PEP-CTERM sorting domain-containing protein [Pirellulales bacterium]